MRPAASRSVGSPDIGVSTIELFFDLVFVFTITQLTSLVAEDPTAVGVARMILVFGNVWWMYGGYAWLTNAVPPREPGLRLLMLLGMAGFLVVALAIPHAFDSSGVAFGVGYLVVNLVHTGMFLRSTEEPTLRAVGRLGPFNAITAVLLLVAGFTDGALQWSLWTAGFVLHWITPYLTNVSGFTIRAAHFVERHGLIVLIALGESIVAIGIGVEGRALGGGFILTSVLGLALAAALWWLYFNGEDERAERSLAAAERNRRPWLALNAFGYAFLPVLGGIVMLAAGIKLAIAHYGEPTSAPTAWFLAAGVTTYVLGLVAFRRLLGLGPVGPRLIIAGLAAATGIVGLAISPQAELAALVAIVGGGVIVEARLRSSWSSRNALGESKFGE
ncbi:MAG: low temperature requirement protein A [Armatimonadota bacterium]